MLSKVRVLNIGDDDDDDDDDDHEQLQLLGAYDFQITKQPWLNRLMYEIILPLQKLVLVYEAMFSLLGSHIDLPEHIIIPFPHRLIHSLEVSINNKTECYANFLLSTWGRELTFT